MTYYWTVRTHGFFRLAVPDGARRFSTSKVNRRGRFPVPYRVVPIIIVEI